MGDIARGQIGTTKGFGLGALEEADDEDIYSTDNMEAYDKVLGGEEAAPARPPPPPKVELPGVRV